MSDLQISLLVIGALVVGAVYVYDWLQEHRLRRRLRDAFGEARDDALLGSGKEPVLREGPLEPQLQPAPAPAPISPAESAADNTAAGGVPAPAAVREALSVPGFDTAFDYVAEIVSDAPIAESMIGELTRKVSACGKPSRTAGFDAERGEWEDLARGAGGHFTRLRVALQLVNRAGPLNVAQLASFCDAVKSCADRVPALAVCPDTQAALASARNLDAFCADVDIAVGVNVVAEDGGTFSGTKIRGLAEAAGFKLEPDGIFHYRDEQRQTLFTLDNHEPAPFLPERIKTLSTHGITLLLDVPRVGDGIRVFERMLELARSFAAALGGKLVDDNRVALSDAGIARIKEQLRSIHAAMETHGIAAGSEQARRLFS
jgi:hypothetical protein